MITYTEDEVLERLNEISKDPCWDYKISACDFWHSILALMKRTLNKIVAFKIIDSEDDGEYSKDILVYCSNGLLETIHLKDFAPEVFENLNVGEMC